MIIYDIGIRCHQQDIYYYCSMACAQMILYKMGLGLPDQGDLYNLGWNNRDEGRWGSFKDPDGGPGGVDPSGLRYVLNQKCHQSLIPLFNQFSIAENTDPEVMTRQIIATISTTKNPVAVLVKNASHWVIARGVHIDGDPNGANDITFSGVIINDPWPPCPYNVPHQYDKIPPHTDNDACGHVGDTQLACDEFIASGEWEDEWLTPVAFIPGSIPSIVAIYKEYRKIKFRQLLRVKHEINPKLGGIIEPDDIKKITLNEARLHGLLERGNYVVALENARPSTPILVQRLDKLDSYYYIVPMVREKMITSTALVDAVGGQLQGFARFNKPVERLTMDREEIMKKLAERPIYMEDNHTKLEFRDGTYNIHPTMVWKLCRESLSKYYPFHMVTIGNIQVYVGLDGKVYSKLHDPGRFG